MKNTLIGVNQFISLDDLSMNIDSHWGFQDKYTVYIIFCVDIFKSYITLVNDK